MGPPGWALTTACGGTASYFRCPPELVGDCTLRDQDYGPLPHRAQQEIASHTKYTGYPSLRLRSCLSRHLSGRAGGFTGKSAQRF
jgi:hypothetical protein